MRLPCRRRWFCRCGCERWPGFALHPRGRWLRGLNVRGTRVRFWLCALWRAATHGRCSERSSARPACTEIVATVARLLLPSWLLGQSVPHSHGTSRWAQARERRNLGRAAWPQQMHGDGIVLGWYQGRLLQSPAEDNVLLFGVQRSGKTSTVVVPTLLGWGGAMVATSTKEELVALTSHHRAIRGPLWVFAPLDRDHSWMGKFGLRPATWNPLDAVDSCGIAAELADHFTADGKRGHSAHWYLAASSLITGLAVCVHERGGDMRTVLARLNRTAHSEFVGL